MSFWGEKDDLKRDMAGNPSHQCHPSRVYHCIPEIIVPSLLLLLEIRLAPIEAVVAD